MAMTKPTSEQVTFLQTGTGATTRTVDAKLKDTVSVKDFGAVGDGVTDDTAAIQATITSAAKKINFVSSSSSYLCGAIQITSDKIIDFDSQLSISGLNAGFELHGNLNKLYINNLDMTGDGVLLNLNRAIWNDQTYTINNIAITNPKVANMVQGIDLGSAKKINIVGGYIYGSVGTSAGQGYGIVIGGAAENVTVQGTTFENNARHGLYIGHTYYSSVIGCHFYKHSDAVPTTNAALAISRGTGYSIIGSSFVKNYGPSIVIDDDTVVSGILSTTSISSNTFFDQKSNSEIIIGPNTAPTINNGVACVSICGNVITRETVNSSSVVVIFSCRDAVISNNTSYIPNTLYFVTHLNDAGPTATAITKLIVTGNVGELSAGGYPVYLDTALCGGTAEIVVTNNVFTNQVEGRPIFYQTNPPTNPNIKHDGQYFSPVTLSAGSQTMNVAGYNNFIITGNGAGSTITNFVNAYEKKIIKLTFVDANTTIDRTNSYLSGGVNFVSTNRDVIILQYISSQWYEISRSVNL